MTITYTIELLRQDGSRAASVSLPVDVGEGSALVAPGARGDSFDAKTLAQDQAAALVQAALRDAISLP